MGMPIWHRFSEQGYIMTNQMKYGFSRKPAEGRQADVETALRIATVMAEANERLFKVQSEAANAVFAENSKHFKALLDTLNTKDSGTLLTEWTTLYQANMRRILDVTRKCFEIVPQSDAEVAKLVGEPFASTNKDTQKYLDQFTRAINESRDAAAASVKDFLAKAIASTTVPGEKEHVA
jgi:16S rRNA A1518/A1519 N6-dimethyltransferase RsmA/KsgA/DIM1 with predicted DNA glycosylase/AP lyase activity